MSWGRAGGEHAGGPEEISPSSVSCVAKISLPGLAAGLCDWPLTWLVYA